MDSESFNLNGSEDEQSFHYQIKMKDFDIYFIKTIIIYMDQDEVDAYEETLSFPTYRFTIGKRIPKINNNIIILTKRFVKDYQCDISEPSYCFVYNKVWQSDYYNLNKKQIDVVPPNKLFEKYSKQLYDKYVKYYYQVIEIAKRGWQCESIKF